MGNKRLISLGTVAILAAATGLRATELTGPHNNQVFDGYDALAGAYDVPADAGGVPSATFNNNGNAGLGVGGAGTSVTIEGGQFNGNFNFGVDAEAGATVTISGGAFDNDGIGANAGDSSSITVSGGQFLNNPNDLLANGGTINLYGGQFSVRSNGNINNSVLAVYGGSANVFGAFAGVTDGQTFNILVNGPGSFYGQLEDNSTAQTYTYTGGGGTIMLHGTGTLVPEPTTLGLVTLAGAGILARRRGRSDIKTGV